MGFGDDLDAVLRKAEVLTSVGQLIGALEQLSAPVELAPGGFLAWDVGRYALPRSWAPAVPALDRLFGHPQVLGLVVARGAAALGLLAPRIGRPARAALSSAMCLTSYGLQARTRYGFDGSDPLAFVTYACAALEKASGGDRRAREAVVAFLAAQACLSYATSGAAKLASPVWRDGSAIPRIFRTEALGDAFLHRAVRDRPWLAKTLSWSTIAGELAFPLVLVAPRPVARAILAAGLAFHLGNARFMGLNRFVWSYCATYPAIAHVSRSLGPPGSRRRWEIAPAVGLAVRAGRPVGVAEASSRGMPPCGAVAALALLTCAGAGAAAIRLARTQRIARAHSAPGRMVRFGHRDVHVLADTGSDGPTVVFESGMACPVTAWSWVLRGLGPDVNYVAYDRPGLGWSAPARWARDAEWNTEALVALLARVGAKPPFLLVGHSVGGVLIRCFARRHLELVCGLVFVDSSHPEQLHRSAGQRETLPWVRQRLTTQWIQAVIGASTAGQADASVTGPFSYLPGETAGMTEARMSVPATWWSAGRELRQWSRSWSHDASRLKTLSSTPVAVLTAGRTALSDPAHLGLQRELVELSTLGRHDIVAGAGHNTLVTRKEYAERVVASIKWALAQNTADIHA
ncbi:alpha/beta fold hydrolase [Streptomyces sp. PTM05]|uniref:Alpha/beta fold hydrolase n=1 Tax=Streptantibioticus parmotrematis TaxID=2873249 RepID=A0ABS7QUY3_9ACTN|nr:alpha/beta fold hydrolase [Streptantibioticus parmotrematis]MBY8887004.1 alpha/beta fold hydrolase [Streptantibioticus parmotrematis]